MKVAVHAATPQLGFVTGNVKQVVAAIEADHAQLVVFPEMFLTGYAIGDDVQRLAFVKDDARLEPIRSACAAKNVHAIVGGPRSARRGVTHNSAFLIDGKGELSFYDKRSLATFTTFEEGLYFKPGAETKTWHTEHGGIGIGICYDLFFPEANRRQMLDGANLLVNISASPATSRPFFEALLQARAIENACFVAYSNNVGFQDGLPFWGGARVLGPRGEMLAEVAPHEPGVAVAETNPSDLRPAREFRPTARDADPKQVERLDAPGKTWLAKRPKPMVTEAASPTRPTARQPQARRRT